MIAMPKSLRFRRGFEIAPVPLNLKNKNRELVGTWQLHRECRRRLQRLPHGTSTPRNTRPGQSLLQGNQPKVVNQNTYLAGGNLFVLIPGITPDIFTRNLTPDRQGVLRAVAPSRNSADPKNRRRLGSGPSELFGRRHDNCFPACSRSMATAAGDAVAKFQNMTDHDLRAIYEYLSPIPCVTGPPSGVLHNDCV